MTKKEITTLLVLFYGGWMIVLGILTSLAAVPQVVAQFTAMPRVRGGESLLLIFVILLPVLFYGSAGWFLVRKSGAFAHQLLTWGKIDGTGVIPGGGVSGLTPLLFSVLGLYFLVDTLPSFLVTAFRWFSLEASALSSTRYVGSDIGRQISAYKADLVHYGLSIALAVFVLLRSTWIAGQVQKFSQRESRS